jgi:hypothetical protein
MVQIGNFAVAITTPILVKRKDCLASRGVVANYFRFEAMTATPLMRTFFAPNEQREWQK